MSPRYNSYSCTYTYAIAPFMTSEWLTNLPLSGWNFPGVNRDQSWFCCCHFCCKENICLDALFLFWRSEIQNQGCRDRGAAPASPADSAARTQHHDSVVASILSLGTVITRSDRDGTELHSSTALYYMCILPPGVMYSTQDNNPITAAPHLLHWQMSFTQEIAATCSRVTPSLPILAMAKRKRTFNASTLLLL